MFLSYFSQKIKNHIDFNIFTQPNYMFDNFMIYLKVFVIQPRKVH